MLKLNAFLIGYLTLFGLSALTNFVLERLNIKNLRRHGAEVPAGFDLDAATLEKMRDYTVAGSRFGSVERLYADVLILVILLSGLLPWYDGLVAGHGLIGSGLLFFAGYMLFTGCLSLPFELYHDFVLEKRFGFSTITLRLWLADLGKTLLVGAVVLGIFLSVILGLIKLAPQTWWLWGWAFYLGFQLLMVWLYPVLIAPLFNRFTPIDAPELEAGIRQLAEKAGMNVSGVFKMDAGTRSRHSNAYFTGFGRTKRIVLFDTLIAGHSTAEILAVLAHELGHFKLGHIKKQLALGAAGALLGFYVAWAALSGELLYASFGLDQASTYAGLLVLSLILKPVLFFVAPLTAMLSRRFERQADRFAFDLTGSSEPLAAGLKRLAADNLANLHPHPAYAWFHYSHPPLVERVRYLEALR
ncbi:MAG: Protease HtpX [Deltaproteobacteria bacterium ADurb.Bin510]|nr:MAG: Protease HtpX [Deltaproteobacteria bacterium ADurb.Bin510]